MDQVTRDEFEALRARVSEIFGVTLTLALVVLDLEVVVDLLAHSGDKTKLSTELDTLRARISELTAEVKSVHEKSRNDEH